MIEIKDLITILMTVGGALVAIVGVYWRMRYKFKDHTKQFCDHERRIARIEAREKRHTMMLMVIEKNLMRLMEKLEVEPVQTLFDDEEDNS